MKTIAEKIIKLRESIGWSQSELARQAGITSAAISQLEKGNRNPSLVVIKKIAAALNVSILDFTNERTTNLADEKIFIRRFAIIRKLNPSDQELIIEIAKRLSK